MMRNLGSMFTKVIGRGGRSYTTPSANLSKSETRILEKKKDGGKSGKKTSMLPSTPALLMTTFCGYWAYRAKGTLELFRLRKKLSIMSREYNSKLKQVNVIGPKVCGEKTP
ncbi:hypothetical protein AALP_AAs51134U000100 [Arabis alpina]|uniref:Uncharacterized protein n=1 Tax=Arabis alpina TaxID=50452 RepID=A0A087G0V2_ARAAL|nr:hypothetical protein AALP_AAs51134U000100 [Arabis alpina]